MDYANKCFDCIIKMKCDKNCITFDTNEVTRYMRDEGRCIDCDCSEFYFHKVIRYSAHGVLAILCAECRTWYNVETTCSYSTSTIEIIRIDRMRLKGRYIPEWEAAKWYRGSITRLCMTRWMDAKVLDIEGNTY